VTTHQMKSNEIKRNRKQRQRQNTRVFIIGSQRALAGLPVGSATRVSSGIIHGLPKLCPRHRVINGKRAERDRKRDGMANGMSSPRVTPNRTRNKPKCCTAHSALTRYTMAVRCQPTRGKKDRDQCRPFLADI
jgi:hypothetical protein